MRGCCLLYGVYFPQFPFEPMCVLEAEVSLWLDPAFLPIESLYAL